MGAEPAASRSRIYEIVVQGCLDEHWSAWFGGMALRHGIGADGSPVTTLTGPVADQAALHGLLGRIRDLNLTLLSVTRKVDP